MKKGHLVEQTALFHRIKKRRLPGEWRLPSVYFSIPDGDLMALFAKMTLWILRGWERALGPAIEYAQDPSKNLLCAGLTHRGRFDGAADYLFQGHIDHILPVI